MQAAPCFCKNVFPQNYREDFPERKELSLLLVMFYQNIIPLPMQNKLESTFSFPSEQNIVCMMQ
jgi:hypothetical protein